MENPPPAGVSSIGEDGERQQVAKPVGRGSRPKHGSDPLRNPEGGRRVASSAPAGVDVRPNDIVEFDIKTSRSKRLYTSFRSVDGEEYSLRIRDSKGKVLPGVLPYISMIAMVEMMKGGNPLDVLDAFKVKIPAEDGKMVFPIPEKFIHLLQSPDVTALEISSETDGFTLGG